MSSGAFFIDPCPYLIVVSGPPGAGKSTLAHALGRSTGFPVVSRDEICEGMLHAGTDDPDQLRAYRTFVDTVTGLIRAGVSVVAEAAFQNGLWRPLLTLTPQVRVIRCVVTPDVARARIAARARTGAHASTPVDVAAWQPIAAAAPTLLVDTDQDYSPAMPEIQTFATSAIHAEASAC